MSIERHPSHNGWYYVKSWPDGRKGKPHRDLVYSYEEAQELDNILKTGVPKTTHPKLADVAAEYLAWAKINLAESTYATRERRIERFIIPFFGRYRVRDLRQQHFDAYAKTVAKWTLHTDITALQAMIAWMVKRGYADKLNWDIEKPKATSNIKPVPDPADLLAAIDSLKLEVHRILMKLMLFAGLRWNEVSRLRWEHVNLFARTIRMVETDADQDFISIPDPLFDWFKVNHKAQGWVFPGRGDKPYSKLWKPFVEIREKIGGEFSPHMLRHASATYLYEQTGDIRLVQAHLRHRRIATTLIYTRMSIKRRQSATASVVSYVDQKTKFENEISKVKTAG